MQRGLVCHVRRTASRRRSTGIPGSCWCALTPTSSARSQGRSFREFLPWFTGNDPHRIERVQLIYDGSSPQVGGSSTVSTTSGSPCPVLEAAGDPGQGTGGVLEAAVAGVTAAVTVAGGLVRDLPGACRAPLRFETFDDLMSQVATCGAEGLQSIGQVLGSASAARRLAREYSGKGHWGRSDTFTALVESIDSLSGAGQHWRRRQVNVPYFDTQALVATPTARATTGA